MNHYNTSSGRVSKSIIDAKVKEAKQALVDSVEHYCHASGRTDERLDCSHIISVKRCQEMGKSELAWDVNNLQLEGRTAHNQWESWEAYAQEVKGHNNLRVKLDYIQKHDPQSYERFKAFGIE